MSELWEALDRAPTLGVTSRKQRTAATWGSVQITVVDSLPYPPSGESFKTPCVVMGHRGRIQLIANPGYVEDLPVDTLDEAVGHVSMRVQENADRLGTTDYTLYVYRDARTGSRRTAATPGWLSERNNDPYGTPGNHEFWTTVDFTDIGKVRVFERDGKGYLHHRMQNYWMNFPSLDAAMEHANSADQNLNMWSSKTAYYNDADIEQMQLDSGFYDDEPPCPGCGAYDSVVTGSTFLDNGYGNVLQQQMVRRAIEGSGLQPNQTAVCMECYAVADNRGGSGMRLLSSLKTASSDLESVARAFARYWGGEFAGIQNSPVSLVDGLWDGPWAVVRNEYGEWAKIKDISGEFSGEIENHRPNPNYVRNPDSPYSWGDQPPYLYDEVMRPAGTYAVVYYDREVMHITTENGQLVLGGYNGNVTLASKTAMPSPAEMNVKVGDIFYNSWGYDQTNIDYYEVIRLTGQGVEVQPIASQVVNYGGPAGNKVVPAPGVVRDFDVILGINRGDAKRSKVCRLRSGYQGETSIVLKSGEHWGRPWRGEPQYETDSMFGH